jgi:glycine hydroxymethyltransferase
LIDLSSTGIGRGKFFQLALECVGLSTNMNTVPGDQGSALLPSGLRLGTPAMTSRGLGVVDMEQVATWIAAVAEHIKDVQMPTDKDARVEVMKTFIDSLTTDSFYKTLHDEVIAFSRRFPLPSDAH